MEWLIQPVAAAFAASIAGGTATMVVLLGVADSSFGDLRRAIRSSITSVFRIQVFDATIGFLAGILLYFVVHAYPSTGWAAALAPGLATGAIGGAIAGLVLGLLVNGRGADFAGPATVTTSSARKLAVALVVGAVHSRAAAVGTLRSEVWKRTRMRRGRHWRDVLDGYRDLLLTNFVLAQELPSHVASFYRERGLPVPRDLTDVLNSWFDDAIPKENGWRADALDRLLGILIREGRLEPVEASVAVGLA